MTDCTLAGLTLEDPDGEPVAVETLIAADGPHRWLVVQALRYYG